MIAMLPIALAAGCASALMFASMISGALISVLLLYLAPLPLMVAALGWGPLCAAIGGITAAIGLGALFGLPYCISFSIGVALPAWWLGHLALLGRPVVASVPPDNSVVPAAVPAVMEWYPVGRILLWAAGFAALITLSALLTLGTDAATIKNVIRRGLLLVWNPEDPASEETTRGLDALVVLAPVAAAVVTMMTLTINLWLAAKITATSGRLHRPWPDMKTTALPPMTLVALSAAIAFCFIGGLLAMLAQTIAAALTMAYGLVGFAVLHTVTLTLKNRALWLSCTYVVVVLFTWPVLLLAALGLADAIFNLRQRYLQSQPPPLPVA
jgi:hypothetical protein